MVTLGYPYTDEVDAAAAVAACDAYYGCPNEATTHWCAYQPWGDAFAIIYDESIEPVLGAPVVLPEIPEPDGLDN